MVRSTSGSTEDSSSPDRSQRRFPADAQERLSREQWKVLAPTLTELLLEQDFLQVQKGFSLVKGQRRAQTGLSQFLQFKRQ